MEKICAICAKDPTAHSFKKIADKNGIVTFYTKPSAATRYSDAENALKHLENSLQSIGQKKWTWLFDGDGFDAKHAMELGMARSILDLIQNKYINQLHQIILINSSWHIKAVIKAGSIAMSDNLQSKIKMLDDRVYSVLEFL
jgi:hypothetical protein